LHCLCHVNVVGHANQTSHKPISGWLPLAKLAHSLLHQCQEAHQVRQWPWCTEGCLIVVWSSKIYGCWHFEHAIPKGWPTNRCLINYYMTHQIHTTFIHPCSLTDLGLFWQTSINHCLLAGILAYLMKDGCKDNTNSN